MNEYLKSNIDEVCDHYLIALLWAEVDDNDVPLDERFDIDDIRESDRAKSLADIVNFIDILDGMGVDLAEDIMSVEQCGHDIYFTRARHGVGFWDRGLGELGDKLTEAAHLLGEVYAYVGDDGELYLD